MAAYKYIVPALAAAGSVAAQQSVNSCSVAATTTLHAAADASALSACRTFTGSIAIATDAQGNIALDGIQQLQGSLIANNVSALTGLSGNMLSSISDSFTLDSTTSLMGLNFPYLEEVDTIDWNAVPELQQLTFSTTIQMVKALSIQDTALSSLDGINLQEAGTILITNNKFLQEISMQLGNVSNSLTLQSNGDKLKAEFPNLIWANNMTIRNLSEIDIPSLQSVNGSLGFYGDEFASLTAPNLTTVGGTLVFVSNEKLSNISLPLLTTVGGGLQIANNTNLANITGFPSLQRIGGAIDVEGNVVDLELPSLKEVKGTLTLYSSKNISAVCDHFQSIEGPSNIILGANNKCHGQDDAAATSTGTPVGGSGSGTSGGSSASSTSSKGAADVLLIPSATGILGLMAVIFGLL